MKRLGQFLLECVAAALVAGLLMACEIAVGHLWRYPLPRSVLQAIVFGTLAVCFLVATLRPGGSLRQP
jgi:hypothetical protein